MTRIDAELFSFIRDDPRHPRSIDAFCQFARILSIHAIAHATAWIT
jgi:hypothetical protein